MRAHHWAVLLGVSVMLGSAFSFTRAAVEELPPVSVAAARVALAALVLWSILRLSGGRLPPLGRSWRQIIIVGVLTGAIPFVCLAAGQVHVQSSVAAILFGAIPLLTLLSAHFMTRDERMTPTRLGGVASGLAGVGLIVGPGALAGLSAPLLGEALILLSAACYGFGSVYARRIANWPPLAMGTGQMICASAILVPLSLALDAPWQLAASIEALGAVAGLAIVGTVLPAPGIFWLIRSVGAISASLLAYFVPLVAVLIGTLMLDESLEAATWAGFVLILTGAAMASRRG